MTSMLDFCSPSNDRTTNSTTRNVFSYLRKPRLCIVVTVITTEYCVYLCLLWVQLNTRCCRVLSIRENALNSVTSKSSSSTSDPVSPNLFPRIESFQTHHHLWFKHTAKSPAICLSIYYNMIFIVPGNCMYKNFNLYQKKELIFICL